MANLSHCLFLLIIAPTVQVVYMLVVCVWVCVCVGGVFIYWCYLLHGWIGIFFDVLSLLEATEIRWHRMAFWGGYVVKPHPFPHSINQSVIDVRTSRYVVVHFGVYYLRSVVLAGLPLNLGRVSLWLLITAVTASGLMKGFGWHVDG